MKQRSLQIGIFSFLLLFLFASCAKDHGFNTPLPAPPFMPVRPILPSIPFDYSSNNPHGITDEGATLGRVLFYEKLLSADNRISCATCHKQELSFADNQRFTKGYLGALTSRNVPTLLNLNPEHDFFWDKREDHLFEMVLKPIQNPLEMGIVNMDSLVHRLQNTGYYPGLFKRAFGSDTVTADRMGQALNQFVLSIRSSNSRFDTDLDANYATWNPDVGPVIQKGQIAFGDRGRCFTCHGGPDTNEKRFFNPDGTVTILTDANIGLDSIYADPGMGAFEAGKEGVFKVPTLRNIALTAPYMHDGRFQTLEEVVDHYSEDVFPHPNLDSRIVRANDGTPFNAEFTEEEKIGLLAFLEMLTDVSITTDERWSNPFPQ